MVDFMRPGKDTIFVDETGKEWKKINWHVRRFDAFRKRDAEQVENMFRGKFLSCKSLTLKTRLDILYASHQRRRLRHW